MKTNILSIILALAVVLLCIQLIRLRSMSNKAQPTEDQDAERVVLDNIATRVSVRSYQDKAVEQEKIERMLRAGMAAPTAVNKQPWHFVAVTEKTLLQQIAAITPNAGMAAQAPLAIVVCGDMSKTLQGVAKDFWIQDASAATENILLAAHALGLGAVWTGTYPDTVRCKAVKELLGLPNQIVPLCTVVAGYPAEKPQPKDKWKPENVSYNVYGEGRCDAVVAQQPRKTDFKAFDVRESFRVNPFIYADGDGLLLASGDSGWSNVWTIGLFIMGILWDHKPTVTVYVRESRHTFSLMEQHPWFSVMYFNDKKVLQYMGSHSGRDGDKAAALGLHVAYTENGTPYYEEAELVLECRMLYKAPFEQESFMTDMPQKYYAKGEANHHLYIGEVVNALRK